MNKIKPHKRNKNAAITVTFGKFPPPKIAMGHRMNYMLWFHVLYICSRYIQSVIQEKENFIHILYRKYQKKKKIKTTCIVIAKQDTVVLQVLMCFLAPVASVQSESLRICHNGAKSSPEVERERESMLWSSDAAHHLPPPHHTPLCNGHCGTFLPHPSPSSLGGTFQATAIF